MLSLHAVAATARRIAHQRAPNPLFGDAEQGEVWVMDADGADAVQLTKNAVAESGAELSPDGTQVLFLADAERDVRDLLQRQDLRGAGGGRRGAR